MTKVKVLIEGYAKKIANGWLASSTVTLVENNGQKIIVDPGCNRSKLLEVLAKNDLAVSDIDYVLCTHNHTDHIVLAGIFENAKILNDTEIYDNDNQIEHGGKIPGTDLQIIPTPGHDQFHCSLIVPTEEGTYAIAGDVFWWEDGEEQIIDCESLLSHTDPYVKDLAILRKSRETLLDVADFIIPGHGKMFKVGK